MSSFIGMQTLTEKVYRLGPPGGVFDLTVVVNLFPDLSRGRVSCY